jgi:hypothetical protein
LALHQSGLSRIAPWRKASATGRNRSWLRLRIAAQKALRRAGVVHTFGSLILLVFVLFLLLGTGLLYDAFAHPLAADSGKVIMGSVCLTFHFLP